MRIRASFGSGMAIALVLVLSGCMQGSTSGTGTPTGATRGSAGQVVERDVEAPEIFSRQDQGLWDGRPSLGGVWVAHPEARDPERVIIRNSENGQETIGALFRRERMNPGPIFQVSAEAASAVSMLAGAPTRIEVIALRTEELRITADADPAPDTAPGTAPEVQIAQAPSAPEDASDLAATGQLADATIPTPMESEPERRGFLSRIFQRAPRDPDSAEGRIDIAALDDPAPLATDSPPQPPQPQAPASPAPAGPAPASPAPERPYIQLGIFSVEANAQRAQAMAQQAGLQARISAGNTQGNAFWRVVVGPAASAAQQRQMLASVKALGFNDAYAVRR